jgi:hypothetical protein
MGLDASLASTVTVVLVGISRRANFFHEMSANCLQNLAIEIALNNRGMNGFSQLTAVVPGVVENPVESMEIL